MDDLRGFGSQSSPYGDDADYASYDDDTNEGEGIGFEAPPLVSSAERRMQVRAYNFWTSLLGDADFPAIDELAPDKLAEFADNGVLLDFTSGTENPSIDDIGEAIRQECDIGEGVGHLGDIPAQSLLARIPDHYLQVIANRAPVGFEAEFVNQRGLTILYRGILLPFSSNEDSIDFIYGVINWKEAASDEVSGDLQVAVADALRSVRPRADPVPVWADAPSRMDEKKNVAAEHLFYAPADADADKTTVSAPGAAATLQDWYTAACKQAQAAGDADRRARAAHHAAIGLAYDFALAAQHNVADYAELLMQMDPAAQECAPIASIAKLVLGADCDEMRLAEYTAALGYADRKGLKQGSLPSEIERYEGGLKALVANESGPRR